MSDTSIIRNNTCMSPDLSPGDVIVLTHQKEKILVIIAPCCKLLTQGPGTSIPLWKSGSLGLYMRDKWWCESLLLQHWRPQGLQQNTENCTNKRHSLPRGPNHLNEKDRQGVGGKTEAQRGESNLPKAMQPVSTKTKNRGWPLDCQAIVLSTRLNLPWQMWHWIGISVLLLSFLKIKHDDNVTVLNHCNWGHRSTFRNNTVENFC